MMCLQYCVITYQFFNAGTLPRWHRHWLPDLRHDFSWLSGIWMQAAQENVGTDCNVCPWIVFSDEAKCWSNFSTYGIYSEFRACSTLTVQAIEIVAGWNVCGCWHVCVPQSSLVIFRMPRERLHLEEGWWRVYQLWRRHLDTGLQQRVVRRGDSRFSTRYRPPLNILDGAAG